MTQLILLLTMRPLGRCERRSFQIKITSLVSAGTGPRFVVALPFALQLCMLSSPSCYSCRLPRKVEDVREPWECPTTLHADSRRPRDTLATALTSGGQALHQKLGREGCGVFSPVAHSGAVAERHGCQGRHLSVFTDLLLTREDGAEPQRASHDGRASEEAVSRGVRLSTAHGTPARSAGDVRTLATFLCREGSRSLQNRDVWTSQNVSLKYELLTRLNDTLDVRAPSGPQCTVYIRRTSHLNYKRF